MATQCAHLDSVKTSHPRTRVLEPGESWSWCYVDELFMELT